MLIHLTQMCSSYRKIFAESPQPMSIPLPKQTDKQDRRSFIGGSDARIIMGDDEPTRVRLWRQKRGEAEPEDLSGNLIVQLGTVTEQLNRHWYERNRHRRATAGFSPGEAVDGGDLGRHGGGCWRGFRGQVHAAEVVLGGSRRRKAHAATAAQYVGHRLKDRGAVDHYRGRAMGRNQNPGRSAVPTSPTHRREEVL